MPTGLHRRPTVFSHSASARVLSGYPRRAASRPIAWFLQAFPLSNKVSRRPPQPKIPIPLVNPKKLAATSSYKPRSSTSIAAIVLAMGPVRLSQQIITPLTLSPSHPPSLTVPHAPTYSQSTIPKNHTHPPPPPANLKKSPTSASARTQALKFLPPTTLCEPHTPALARTLSHPLTYPYYSIFNSHTL